MGVFMREKDKESEKEKVMKERFNEFNRLTQIQNNTSQGI